MICSDLHALSGLRRPSMYLGHELNAVHKERGRVELRLALAFPDMYDLALGNLGLQVLYGILNSLPWAWAERVHAPAPDAEALLRQRGIALGTLESGDALRSLDGLGFTLQTELTYTNVLGILDLAGIPLRAADRGPEGPLVFCGGPGVFNPEPMAPFMDFMVLGDGEEVIVELAEALRRARHLPRTARIEAVSGIQGVYVPSLWGVAAGPDGALVAEAGRPAVRRRVVEDLETAHHPVRSVLPFTEQVHERIAIEVMRGCVRGCRFCQAGATSRPVRERSVEQVADLMERSLAATGHGEASLLSLSTCDHSRARELLAQAAACAAPWRASVALPSIRLDAFSIDLAESVGAVRRSGLTFAPEAATARLRRVINKPIQDDQLIEIAEEAAARGWEHLKLYFMIGLPTEQDEDVLAIADLARRVSARARGRRGRVRLNLGISTFVPKAWTPFQWAPQIGRGEIHRRQGLLLRALGRERGIRLGRHDANESWIEGLLARGDRTSADLIEHAWRLGARFDGWSEHRRVDCWEQALEARGLSEDTPLGARDPAVRLPWDHLDPLVHRTWLEAEWRRARDGELLEDCRIGGCTGCGVRASTKTACSAMLERPRPGASVPVAPAQDLPGSVAGAPEPRGRVVLRVSRLGPAGLLSHLEVAAVWQRAMRRARLPVSHSQGFHAHPRFGFAAALPVGEESVDDFVELWLDREMLAADVAAALAIQLPAGFGILGAAARPLRAPALMSMVAGITVLVLLPRAPSDLAVRCAALASRREIPVERRTKGGVREADLAGTLAAVDVLPPASGATGSALVLATLVDAPGTGRMKPAELLGLLGVDPTGSRVLRLLTLARGERGLLPMAEHLDISETTTDRGWASELDPDLACFARCPPREFVRARPAQVSSEVGSE